MRDQTGKRNEGATSMEIALMDRTCLFRMEEIQCRMHESSNSQRLPYGALICVFTVGYTEFCPKTLNTSNSSRATFTVPPSLTQPELSTHFTYDDETYFIRFALTSS